MSIVKIASTFFGIGYLPFAPGTFASIAALVLFLFVRANTAVCFLTGAFLVVLGFLVCGRAEEMFSKKDAGQIVIDEACGMFLSLAFMTYGSASYIILGFVFFRLFDIFKPYPIGSLQKLRGSLGVMADDLLAAAYTNFALLICFKAGFF